ITDIPWERRSLPEQVAGDDGALDFAGTFVDGDDAGVAVHALDFGFAGVALAAVDLHGFVDDAIDHFAGVEFGAGGGGRRGSKGSRGSGGKAVLLEGGVVEEGAGGFDFGVHVGEHELDGLEFGDGFVEGGLGEAYGLRGDADTSAIKSGESDLEALAFFAEAIDGGDFAIVEDDFHGGRAALAHFVFVAADGEAGEGGFDEEGGNSLPAEFRVRFGEDEIDAGVGAVGDPGFGARKKIGGTGGGGS